MSPSAYELYDFFLKASDLGGKATTVQIGSAQARDTFNPNTQKTAPKLTLSLIGKRKKIILNKTQVAQLIEITGTDDYTQWRGWITISPIKSRSGKDTIKISHADPASIPPPRPTAEILAELGQ